MHQIKINKTTYQLPSSWEEMDKKTWTRIAPLVIAGKIYTKEMLALLMTRKIMGIKRLVSIKIIENLTAGQQYELYNCIQWIKKDPCTHPPFKSWRIKRKRYFLPDFEFRYMTVIEYALLDLCYQVYQRLWERNEFDLADQWRDKLVSYMARPRDSKINPNDPETFLGERRERMNTLICDRRIPIFRKAPTAFKYGCLLYFVGCKRFIHEKYRNTIFFDTHTDDGQEIMNVAKKEPNPKEWIEIVMRLSGGKFGDLKETQYTNLYDILEELKIQQKKV